MDVTVNSQALAQELRLLEKIVSQKIVIPVLANVLFRANGTLQMHATDLDVGLSTVCPATIAVPGAITLPAKRLLGIVEQLTDADVRLVQQAGQVHVLSGAFKSRLQTLPAADFPVMPAVAGDVSTLSGVMLRSLIAATRFAVSEKGQPILTGALFSMKETNVVMVATDGKRLSLATGQRTPAPAMSAIIPKKTLDVLLAQDDDGPIAFSRTDRHLFFAGKRLLTSRMLEGEYPAYDRVIPKQNDKSATVDRTQLAATLRRVGMMAEDFAVYLTFTSGSLRVTASSATVGDADESLAIAYKGPDLKVCISWQYVLDFLEAATSQAVTVTLKQPDTPLLFLDGNTTSGGEGFLNVILGMRV